MVKQITWKISWTVLIIGSSKLIWCEICGLLKIKALINIVNVTIKVIRGKSEPKITALGLMGYFYLSIHIFMCLCMCRGDLHTHTHTDYTKKTLWDILTVFRWVAQF